MNVLQTSSALCRVIILGGRYTVSPITQSSVETHIHWDINWG